MPRCGYYFFCAPMNRIKFLKMTLYFSTFLGCEPVEIVWSPFIANVSMFLLSGLNLSFSWSRCPSVHGFLESGTVWIYCSLFVCVWDLQMGSGPSFEAYKLSTFAFFRGSRNFCIRRYGRVLLSYEICRMCSSSICLAWYFRFYWYACCMLLFPYFCDCMPFQAAFLLAWHIAGISWTLYIRNWSKCIQVATNIFSFQFC